MKRLVALLALMLALMSSGSASLAQSPTPEALLGASLTTSSVMDGTTAQTTITSLATVPVTIRANARLTENLDAYGFRYRIEPKTLQPGETATVTLRRGPVPTDVWLDLYMGAAGPTSGMDTTALRFPVAITDPAATPQSEALALVLSLIAELRSRL